jgi:hypothetical protein
MAEQQYTFAEDYYEPLIDGSGRKKLFSAGDTVSWETAYAICVVKTKRPPKDEAPAAPVLPRKVDKS